MFLAQLNEPEKRAWLRLAHELIAVDGVMPSEFEMYVAALTEMGLEVGAEAEPNFDLACEAFISARTRKIALLELHLLAEADGRIQVEESDLLGRVAERLGFPPEVNTWARRWANLVHEPYRAAVRYVDAGALQPAG